MGVAIITIYQPYSRISNYLQDIGLPIRSKALISGVYASSFSCLEVFELRGTDSPTSLASDERKKSAVHEIDYRREEFARLVKGGISVTNKSTPLGVPKTVRRTTVFGEYLKWSSASLGIEQTQKLSGEKKSEPRTNIPDTIHGGPYLLTRREISTYCL